MLKIGVLLPRSTLFPNFGLDILNSIKQSLLYHKAEGVTYIIDNIGFGLSEQEIYGKAEKMVLQDDVDVVVAVADTRNTEILQPLFAATNKIMLVVNCGTDIPENWSVAATTIIHTLNFSMNARLTGALAAQAGNKKTINTLSYYDAGYFQGFSMFNGNQEQGGVPVLYHITKLKLDEFTLEPLAAFAAENPDIKKLLCLFCGDQADRFLNDIIPLQQQYNFELYGAPMLFYNQAQQQHSTLQISGYVPWHPLVSNEVNTLFTKQLENAGMQANYFSVLGWDTGTILQHIYQQKNNGTTAAAQIVNQLKQSRIHSPRGWLQIDAETKYTGAPSYLLQCNAGTYTCTEAKVDYAQEFNAFREVKVKVSETSSWRNTYLCI